MNLFWMRAKGILHLRQTASPRERLLLKSRPFSVNHGPCFKSHYEVLGVSTSATKKEIRDGYIKNSKLCHPDNDPSDPTLHQKFLAVQQAYDILSSDEKRHAYDAGRTHHFRQSSTSSSYSQHSASWGEDTEATKEQVKNRAFWTDPEYHRRNKETQKMRMFGREFETKEANRIIVIFAMLWMTLGTAFVYYYVKYVFGRREYEAIEKQRRIAQNYSSVREAATTTSRTEAMDRLKGRLKVKADQEKKDDDDDR